MTSQRSLLTEITTRRSGGTYIHPGMKKKCPVWHCGNRIETSDLRSRKVGVGNNRSRKYNTHRHHNSWGSDWPRLQEKKSDGIPWWRHQKGTSSALLALCAGNSPVTDEFPAQRTVTRGFGVFFDLRLNERLSKQRWGWWFETPSHLLLKCKFRSTTNFSEQDISYHSMLVALRKTVTTSGRRLSIKMSSYQYIAIIVILIMEIPIHGKTAFILTQGAMRCIHRYIHNYKETTKKQNAFTHVTSNIKKWCLY